MNQRFALVIFAILGLALSGCGARAAPPRQETPEVVADYVLSCMTGDRPLSRDLIYRYGDAPDGLADDLGALQHFLVAQGHHEIAAHGRPVVTIAPDDGAAAEAGMTPRGYAFNLHVTLKITFTWHEVATMDTTSLSLLLGAHDGRWYTPGVARLTR